MPKEKQPSKSRIIIVTTCGSCPHHTHEETEKNSYLFCWALMRSIKHLDKVLEECPLEEIEFEWEDDGPDVEDGPWADGWKERNGGTS